MVLRKYVKTIAIYAVGFTDFTEASNVEDTAGVNKHRLDTI